MASSALQAQRLALDVTAHNVANAATKGYSRQVVTLAPGYPQQSASGRGQVGSGVVVQGIERVRDRFLDMQYRAESSSLGRWETLEEALREIQVMFNEPSQAGLREVLNQLWRSFQELANNPEDPAVRTMVLEDGRAFAEAVRHTYRQLTDLQSNVNEHIAGQVEEINLLVREIAHVSGLIARTKVGGDEPNDLLDRRDLLLDQLARMVDVEVKEDDVTGSVFVSVNGVVLVDGSTPNLLVATPGPGGGYEVRTEGGNVLTVKSGSLRGLLELRDEIIPRHLQNLETWVTAIMDAVNLQHAAGYDINGQAGQAFFVTAAGYSVAGSIEVNPALEPQHVAASSMGEQGDGANALALADVKGSPLVNGASPDDFYLAWVASLGIEGREAERMVENGRLLTRQIELQRDDVAGVSLDEEMTRMIMYQHAYNAAARMITALDEALDVVINRMGLVGR